MDAWKKCVLSAGKPMSIKFCVLGGGFERGGGEVPILFLWARGFFLILVRLKSWGWGSLPPFQHKQSLRNLVGISTPQRNITLSLTADTHPGACVRPPSVHLLGKPHRFAVFSILKIRTLRAQILKNFKILKFSSELEIFKRATHQTPIFSGEFWRSGLKISSEIEKIKIA